MYRIEQQYSLWFLLLYAVEEVSEHQKKRGTIYNSDYILTQIGQCFVLILKELFDAAYLE